MNVIRCKNGHFFDGDSYSTCPHCGEAAMSSGGTTPAKEEKKSFWGRGRKDKETDVQPVSRTPFATPRNDFGSGDTPTDVMESGKPENASEPLLKKNPTLDFWQTSSHSDELVEECAMSSIKEDSQDDQVEAAEKVVKEAPPVMEQPETKKEGIQREESKHSEQSTSLREVVKKSSASNEGKTMSYFSSTTSPASVQSQPRHSAEPVVGWLVCVGGCHFGECFEIYAGKNSIGRSEENRVVISDDNSISRVKHALIVYEPKKRNFYLQPGDSSGLTYLNDDYITDSHKLTMHDMIELGDSKFMFVPLCGEAFSWEEHMPKGE